MRVGACGACFVTKFELGGGSFIIFDLRGGIRPLFVNISKDFLTYFDFTDIKEIKPHIL